MTREQARAFSDAYRHRANDTQARLDELTFAAGQVAGLTEYAEQAPGVDVGERIADATDQVARHLRQLRDSVDELDAALSEHLAPNGQPLSQRCPIMEVRHPQGWARCTLPAGHQGEHDYPA